MPTQAPTPPEADTPRGANGPIHPLRVLIAAMMVTTTQKGTYAYK